MAILIYYFCPHKSMTGMLMSMHFRELSGNIWVGAA